MKKVLCGKLFGYKLLGANVIVHRWTFDADFNFSHSVNLSCNKINIIVGGLRGDLLLLLHKI